MPSRELLKAAHALLPHATDEILRRLIVECAARPTKPTAKAPPTGPQKPQPRMLHRRKPQPKRATKTDIAKPSA
jgi:hypothetical protein